MISMNELLMGKVKLEDLPQEHQDNLAELLVRANKVREAYAKPMRVTSGYRSIGDHLRIYREKGITDQAKIPMKSKHLYGQAVDFYDPDGALKNWVMLHMDLMEEIGLWFEDFTVTTNWCHMQIVSPRSGKRVFMP